MDLPGYGYAGAGRTPPTSWPKWRRRIARDASARERADGPGTLLLVDSRHPGLESDVQASRWLSTVGPPPRIVATKIDKLSRGGTKTQPA